MPNTATITDQVTAPWLRPWSNSPRTAPWPYSFRTDRPDAAGLPAGTIAPGSTMNEADPAVWWIDVHPNDSTRSEPWKFWPLSIQLSER